MKNENEKWKKMKKMKKMKKNEKNEKKSFRLYKGLPFIALLCE